MTGPLLFNDFMALYALRERHGCAATEAPATFAIVKASDDLQIAWGWASVSTVHGKPVVDTQGDVIGDDTLRDAAHAFIAGPRTVLHRHGGEPVGEVVESFVMTRDVQKALGIDLGITGWLVSVRIRDPAVWENVKAGQLRSFSIAGRATREPIEDGDADPEEF